MRTHKEAQGSALVWRINGLTWDGTAERKNSVPSPADHKKSGIENHTRIIINNLEIQFYLISTP